MSFKLVDSISDAMHVRKLRNSCRLDLTNAQNHIGFVQQLRWYFGKYRRDRRDASYRVFLLYEEKMAVGFGALALRDGQMFVTECVAAEFRGRGHGRLILERLIQIANAEDRDLMAEIWATNSRSVHLHESAGFELVARTMKDGGQLLRYHLLVNKA